MAYARLGHLHSPERRHVYDTLLAPREKNASAMYWLAAIIAALGHSFTVLRAWSSTPPSRRWVPQPRTGPHSPRRCGRGWRHPVACSGRSPRAVSLGSATKTTLMWVGPFLLFEALLGPISPPAGRLQLPILALTRIIGGIGFGAAIWLPRLRRRVPRRHPRTPHRIPPTRDHSGPVLHDLINTTIVSFTGGAGAACVRRPR